MCSVVDISGRFAPDRVLRHPAGPVLPLAAADRGILPPEIRAAFVGGHYCRSEIAVLGAALRRGDRVLDIGAGLGLTAAVTARSGLAAQVIAVEADPRLLPLARRLLRASGAGGVELVRGVPAHGRRGEAPVFLRRDLRATSTTPQTGPWQGVAMAPYLALDLILAETRIDLVLCDIADGAGALLGAARLDRVDRVIATRRADHPDDLEDRLRDQGFAPDAEASTGRALLFRRARP